MKNDTMETLMQKLAKVKASPKKLHKFRNLCANVWFLEDCLAEFDDEED